MRQLARKHALDLSDALQLETILHGTFQHFAGDSKPILITADGKLQEAAQKEGIGHGTVPKRKLPLRLNKVLQSEVKLSYLLHSQKPRPLVFGAELGRVCEA